MEVPAADQLAVTRRAPGVTDHGDDTVLDRELLHRYGEPLRRALDQ